MSGSDQKPLFDAPPSWAENWQGMPEFKQETKREYAKIVFRFRSQEDLDAFAKLINQTLNRNSQATWYPELGRGELQGHMKYVDES